jgi:glycosyltransferase involved in cell wall biosynthesis
MTTTPSVDILMITYQAPDYVRMSLPRLLETCGDHGRVWLWHNGDDEATLEAVHSYRDDERVARFHHSRENVGLRIPTNWLWENSQAEFVSKVDDDCLESPGWLETFVAAHRANDDLGVLAAWRFFESDFRPDVAQRKIRTLAGGHQVMLNLWVQGSGHVLKRNLVERWGSLRRNESFTQFCVRVARKGAINGWYYPFVREDHMDDPRSPNTGLRNDDDFMRRGPLSAKRNGVTTLAQWDQRQRAQAALLQEASLDLGPYRPGFRRLKAAVVRRVGRGRTVSWH